MGICAEDAAEGIEGTGRQDMKTAILYEPNP